MAPIKWDEEGAHVYQTGVNKGVLFPYDLKQNRYGNGVAWNGLKSVSESPEGAESSDVYADNIKYLTLISAENLKFTIEAYTYPDEFAECDGTAALLAGVNIGQQPRTRFAFSYCTKLGNDTKSDQYGELLHIIYGAMAAPSEKPYSTISDSPEAITFSWECSTTPINVTGFQPTSLITVDSTKLTPEKYKKITDKLYGAAGPATLLTPDEIKTLVAA
jgi:hypothetical protein|nr:MAG TPA: tail tube protein [Caudoviricetes sp.]